MTPDSRRAAASATISFSGVVVLAVMTRRVVTAQPPVSGWLLAGFGGLVGAALVAAGYLVYRAEFTVSQTLRIAGWNALGIVVIGAALALLYAYQSAVAELPAAPVFSGTVVVAVSAVAHVLIGVNDARRIRARELAREREKLDVLSRLVRHNLRTEAQRLYSYATRVTGGDEDVADDVHAAGERLAELHEHITTIRDLVENPPEPRPYDVGGAVENVAADLRNAYPAVDVDVTVEVSTAAAGGYVEDAVRELVENAIEHNDSDEPWVGVEVSEVDGRVAVAVRDNGPGVPEVERELVTGEREITQLSHGSGVGLWLVRWIADAYDGTLSFEDREDGSGVVLSLPAA